ncbi:MAG: hypothetical protein B7Z68_06915, partial [Acidobacteria bacterium 21-70-11]
MVAFVIVALILNAQFTWWVVYSLRDNRERLDLERELVVSQTSLAAERLAVHVLDAERAIAELPPGVIPSPTPPFAEVRVVEEAELPRGAGARPLDPGATIGWVEQGGRLAVGRSLGRGRVALAFLDPQAAYRWLAA